MKNDIATVLKADQELLRNLAGEMRRCWRADAAHAKFRQFSTALGGHLSALKNVLYPGLKAAGLKGAYDEVLSRHTVLSRSFAELLTIKEDSSAFTSRLAELLGASERLIDAERRELLPLLAEHLDSAQCLTMGIEAQDYFAHRSDTSCVDSRFPAAEWLEEARLLIGGFGATPSDGAAAT